MLKSLAVAAIALSLLASGGPMSIAQAARHMPGHAASVLPSDAVFRRRCAMCHAVSGKGGQLGPDLAGVVGRKAGSGAYAFSPAMRGSKVVWDAATLDGYLAAPNKVIPGTRMTISVSQAEDRNAIIAYLASTKPAAR